MPPPITDQPTATTPLLPTYSELYGEESDIKKTAKGILGCLCVTNYNHLCFGIATGFGATACAGALGLIALSSATLATTGSCLSASTANVACANVSTAAASAGCYGTTVSVISGITLDRLYERRKDFAHRLLQNDFERQQEIDRNQLPRYEVLPPPSYPGAASNTSIATTAL